MKNSHLSKNHYDHQQVEQKWQKYWISNKTFFTNLEDFTKPKKYILPMFPYPSGSGLHVGHVRNYLITDAAARFYRMNGFNVLTTIGWDAFGLPSEQYAIQTNNHPSFFTEQNIQKFKNQLINLGFSYDWTKEVNTSEPAYYRWTQWIFKQLYLQKLADYVETPVFWCESLSTVLSNEEVKNNAGKLVSERGSFPVVRRKIPQWVLRITKYANELVEGLETVDWPLSIHNLQKNWIGVTTGTAVKFAVVGSHEFLTVFTTRPDTVIAANSIAISATHNLLTKLTTFENSHLVKENYENWEKETGSAKNSQQLIGQFTGSYCVNPISLEKIPIWVTNFVLEDYGTGALMISPFTANILTASSENRLLNRKEKEQNYRIDYRFSVQYNLPIKVVATITDSQQVAYVDSIFATSLSSKEEAIEKVNKFLSQRGLGTGMEVYHLRDWVFSRQRYWGEPIPVLHLRDGSTKALPDNKLPLVLPMITDFTPSRNYYSPLQKAADWLQVNTKSLQAKRDVNIMPQWAGSCWYYIAFLLRSKHGYRKLNCLTTKKLLDHWLPVDIYVGGQEHANLHLLYARFWYKVLQKIRIVKNSEPFQKLLCQGMILGANGEKMSKSRGNVINPDHCVTEWGADALRLYEAFLAPPEQTSNFSVTGVAAMRKWLNRVYFLFIDCKEKFCSTGKISENLEIAFRKLVVEVTNDYRSLKLNIIVAKLMAFINQCYLSEVIPHHYGKAFLQLLNPLAPHISEELWSTFSEESIAFSKWPSSEVATLPVERSKTVVQVDGKKKAVFEFPIGSSQSLLEIAKMLPSVQQCLINKQIAKVITIGEKLLNIVTKDLS